MSEQPLLYGCSRCGMRRTSTIGSQCDLCIAWKKHNDAMWAIRKCGVCGQQAVGYNINGAFCGDPNHYGGYDNRLAAQQRERATGP